MKEVIAPTVNDFISAFGCDAKLTDDYILTCNFIDSTEKELQLGIGHLDNSFSLSLYDEEEQVLQFYDETLIKLEIKNNTSFRATFSPRDGKKVIYVEVWPLIKIKHTLLV